MRPRELLVRWISRFWKDLAVVAMYGVAAMVFYWPALFGGQTLLPLDNLWTMAPWYGPANAVPHNLLVSDMLLQNYPWKLILDQALQQRQLPLWNPYEMAGLPYLATGQTGALYPFVVLFLILGPLAAYGWYCALHQVLAGSLSYAFLRRLGIGRIGAAIGGFVFAFCFFLTVSYIWPMVLGAAVWLPLALWSLVGLAQAAASGKWSGALARDLPGRRARDWPERARRPPRNHLLLDVRGGALRHLPRGPAAPEAARSSRGVRAGRRSGRLASACSWPAFSSLPFLEVLRSQQSPGRHDLRAGHLVRPAKDRRSSDC